MGKADYCTSAMAVINAEAVAGTKVCGTLAEAVAAAEAGEKVTLLRNVQLDALLTIDKSVTLDLGEYNITRDGRTAIYVEGDVEVAINGEGTVSGKQALYVGGGLVKVNGGNFHGLTEAVYVQNNGKAEIYGGTFSSDNVIYVLNEYDKTRENSDIIVYGGTFTGFNPADNAAEGQGTNFVAAGYVVVDNGDGTYTVKENPAYGKVAKVGDVYYDTFDEAYAAAEAGATIELLATAVIAEDKTYENATVKAEFGNDDVAFRIQDGKTVTFNNMNVEADDYCFIVGEKEAAANLVINGGNYKGETSIASVTKGNLTITDGTFEVAPYEGNYNYTFNCYDASYKNGEATVAISGGKFYNYNPADNAAEGAGTNFVAEGYVAFEGAENWWTVAKAVAQVGEQKFASIQAAIDAAQNNETVTLIADVELSTANTVIQNDGYAVLVNVAGKKVTIDLNGKNVTVNAEEGDVADAKGGMLLAVFHADTNGELIFTDNTEDKSGAVVVNVNDAKVYSVFTSESKYTDKSESGKIIVNAGDYKTVGKLANAMFFADANEVITINGGNFYCDGASTGTPYPWMVNTLGNDVLHVVVKGGTFNVEINKQHRKYEVYVPNECFVVKNSDNTWTVCDGAVARVNGVSYATLAEAVEAAVARDEVTLLKDATGAGVVIDKSITIDFGGHTYTFNKAVGSTGTETLGFQILKGTEVVLQNGTLTSTEVTEGKDVKVLVQNYADALTLEDMNLVDGTEHILYALSNNNGETKLTGNTNITTDAVAFDSYKSKYYDAPTVYVETTGTIDGKIEKNEGATIAISGGIFTTPILPEWCAEYYVPVTNNDDTYGVEYRYIEEMTIDDDLYSKGIYTKFENEKDQTVGTLTYKRTFKYSNVWQSLYVPFEIPVATLSELGYEVAYLYDVHNKIIAGEEIDPALIESVHFVKIAKGTLKANYPYIIRPSKEANLKLELVLDNAKLHSTQSKRELVESSTTTTRYIFTGTYADAYRADITGDVNIPCLRVISDGTWQKMSDKAILIPFRICMYIVNKDGSPVIVSEEAAKSIKIRIVGEENEDGTTTIYDIENDIQDVDYIFDLQGRRVLEPQKGGIYIVNGKKIVF